MRILPAVAVATAMLTCQPAGAASVTAPEPSVDKQKLSAYLRYAEGIANDVTIQVDDPAPTDLPGFYLLKVHLALEGQTEDRKYYVSQDGQRLINGSFWSLDKSPFADTLSKLTLTGPTFGVADAKVTIVVFSDFECPYCKELAKNLRTNIPQKYPKDVRVIVKNFPITEIHPWARAAAEAGACMADASLAAYWAYHDWLYDHQADVNKEFKNKRDEFPSYLKETAATLAQTQQADAAKVRTCIDTHASATTVNADWVEGTQLAIASTPTFYINGRPVGGAIPWSAVDTLIQLELNRPKDIHVPLALAASK